MMEMQSVEVMRTDTNGFDDISEALRWIVEAELDGWAVRQIETVAHTDSVFIFVVMEDNR